MSIKQRECVVLAVVSELFVQHSVDVKGEHGLTRRRPHWASITMETEKKKRFMTTAASNTVSHVDISDKFPLTTGFEAVLWFYLQLLRRPSWTVSHLRLLQTQL